MPSWIYNYQTLLVGIVGFAGVIATLSINAWQQRQQHETDKTEAEQEREKAANRLRRALYEELRILAATMRTEIDDVPGRFRTKNFSLEPGTQVFDAFLSKIDLLTSHEIQRLIVAYLTRKEFVEETTEILQGPFQVHNNTEIVAIQEGLERAIDKVESAKNALEGNLVEEE